MPVVSRHPRYTSWISDWSQLRDFVAGERAVKNKDKATSSGFYLPRLTDQTPEEYHSFVERAVFFNAVRRTLEGLVGLVFRRPPEIELPESEESWLRPKLECVTSDGEPFEIFARRIVHEVLLMGRFGGLVDRPPKGGDPYFVGYQAETITNWRTGFYEGRRRPDQILAYEVAESASSDGFGTSESYRYRELALDEDGFYVQRLYPEDGDGNFLDVPEGPPVRPEIRGRPFTEIPFVFFGAEDLRPEVRRPPLMDICSLNLHHYRASADLAHGRHYTAIPTYWVTAPQTRDEQTHYAVGPNRVWLIEPEGSAGILEFNGQGLTYLENATADIERQMAVLGARLIFPPRRTASESSETTALRERGEQATLYSILDVIEQGLNKLLSWWVEWQDVDPAGTSIRFNRDFSDTRMGYREALMLMRYWQSHAIPLDVLLEALHEGELLPTRATPKRIKDLLEQPGQLPDIEAPGVGGVPFQGTTVGRSAPAGFSGSGGSGGDSRPSDSND